MRFKEGISLDDSNFNMENYYYLADVKLLLTRILDHYWNNPQKKISEILPLHSGIIVVLSNK